MTDDQPSAGGRLPDDEPSLAYTLSTTPTSRLSPPCACRYAMTAPYGVEWVEVSEEVAGQYDMRVWRDHP